MDLGAIRRVNSNRRDDRRNFEEPKELLSVKRTLSSIRNVQARELIQQTTTYVVPFVILSQLLRNFRLDFFSVIRVWDCLLALAVVTGSRSSAMKMFAWATVSSLGSKSASPRRAGELSLSSSDARRGQTESGKMRSGRQRYPFNSGPGTEKHTCGDFFKFQMSVHASLRGVVTLKMEASCFILQFVNKDWEPVTCEIKKYCADFVVQEVTSSGAIVPLLSVPETAEIYEAFVKRNQVAVENEEKKLKPNVITNQLLAAIAAIENGGSNVVIDCTGMEKPQRKEIHEWVRSEYPIIYESKTDGDNIVISKAKNGSRKRKNWPEGRPEFLCFTLAKQDMETYYALSTIANMVRMSTTSFGIAGTKDRRAITTQRVSVYHGDPARFNALNQRFDNMRIYDFTYDKEALKLGHLQGNQFRIVLRDLRMESTPGIQDLKTEIEQRVETWKHNGFINYFGTQRFGSIGIGTGDVGKLILQKDYKGAVMMLLQERDYVKGDLTNALQYLHANDLDFEGANRLLVSKYSRNSIEGKLFAFLARQKTNWRGAILALPRRTRSMYVHAYQSLVFNEIASKRFEKHGFAVLDGDLGADGKPLVPSEDGAVDPYEVCLPLPSHEMVLPENEVGSWVKEILARDDITDESFRCVQKEFAVGAVLRLCFVKPTNVTVAFSRRYVNDHLHHPNLNVYPNLETLPVTPREIGAKGDELHPELDREKVSVTLTFTLPSGVYATIALREVTHRDNSSTSRFVVNGDVGNAAEEATE
ncbi:hypothetical protein L596_005467 [Steinernema carpocapsae]|uniref:TRUD domain-containing protein n=1 Tax=Steinernema carpocapsae TaxID=34508 RepID=A0A4U8V0P3_STECR|nr:hypothetical protein L596_005467 [Steinernema carpocapsae]